jgi:hypothetical protein
MRKESGGTFEIPSEADKIELEASQFDSEKDKQSKRERSPQEVRALKDRLRFVAKTLSQNFGLRLIPGQGWAAGLSEKFQEERRKHPEKSLEEFDEKLLAPEIMTYPEKDLLDRSEDYIFGVFRHEVGHLKHSDYRSLLEAQEGAKKEGYQPMDLFMIYDAWEDGRSNALEGQSSPAARRRLGNYLQEDIAEALTHDFEKRPLPIQYGALCWAKGAEPFIKGFDFEAMKAKIKDEKVLKAYEETQGVLSEYLGEGKGRKAFQDVLWKKGWPVFKELIDKYVEDEAKQQHEESEKGSQSKKQQGGGESGESEESQQASGEQNQNSEGSSNQQETKESEAKSGTENESESRQGQPSSEEKSGSPGRGGKEERSWDDLSPQEKERYRKAAREKLTEEEREFVGRLQPKSVEIHEKKDGTLEIKPREVTEKDVEKAEAEEKEQAKRDEEHGQEIDRAKQEAGKAAHEAQERLRERVTGLTEKEREQYNVYFDGIRKYVNVLVDRLDEVFPPQQNQAWEGGQQRGKRIDAKKLAREIPTERGRFFETKEAPEVREAAFSLLIDVSGSMKGKKIVEALKAAILMAEAFSKKGVPFEILAFHDQLLELKGFDEDYFGKKKLEIMRVLQEVQSPNARWNDDGYAVDAASRRLQRKLLENSAAGALIVLSDGEPAPSPTHAGSEWELHDIVRKWSKQIPLIGVGIGREMEATIKEYYDKNGLPVPDVSKLPQALLKILSNQLSRFEKKST